MLKQTAVLAYANVENATRTSSDARPISAYTSLLDYLHRWSTLLYDDRTKFDRLIIKIGRPGTIDVFVHYKTSTIKSGLLSSADVEMVRSFLSRWSITLKPFKHDNRVMSSDLTLQLMDDCILSIIHVTVSNCRMFEDFVKLEAHLPIVGGFRFIRIAIDMIDSMLYSGELHYYPTYFFPLFPPDNNSMRDYNDACEVTAETFSLTPCKALASHIKPNKEDLPF